MRMGSGIFFFHVSYFSRQLFCEFSHGNTEGVRKFHQGTETRLTQAFFYDGKFPRIFLKALGKSVLGDSQTLALLDDEFS